MFPPPRVVIADKFAQISVAFKDDVARRYIVQKLAVVRNEQHGAVEIAEQFFEQIERLQIEVVCRFVEHEHVCRFEKNFREQKPVALASAEHRNR